MRCVCWRCTCPARCTTIAQLRGELMLAAVLCGQGTDHTGAGIATVLGHAIGARYEVDNGVTKAIVLAVRAPLQCGRSEARAAEGGHRLGLHGSASEPPVATVVNAVEAMFSRLGIPRRLRDVGVARDALSDIAASAMGDWFLRGNPRPVRDGIGTGAGSGRGLVACRARRPCHYALE